MNLPDTHKTGKGASERTNSFLIFLLFPLLLRLAKCFFYSRDSSLFLKQLGLVGFTDC